MQKKGDVWVSTVLYVLISLAVLSLVLASVQPIIEKNRDRTAAVQSEKILREIDSTIRQVSNAQGNKLSLNIKISQGNLIINSSDNLIVWNLEDSSYQYSQESRSINLTSDGRLKAFTIKKGSKWDVKLYLDYNGYYNITYEGQETPRILSQTEYDLSIENVNPALKQIDFSAS